jgi:hypothetical protein
MTDNYNFVLKVIKSCSSAQQLKSAKNLIELFHLRHRIPFLREDLHADAIQHEIDIFKDKEL